MTIKQIATNLFVGPQIAAEDLQTLAQAGFTDVVCNLPDSEVKNGNMSKKLELIARQNGLAFHYQPIEPGAAMHEQARQLSQVAGQSDAKVFAYCRSGARSSGAWALAQSF